jgi:hypothetical protein
MMEDPSFHTAALPQLYNEYQQAMASMSLPDYERAIRILGEIGNRCLRARDLLIETRTKQIREGCEPLVDNPIETKV